MALNVAVTVATVVLCLLFAVWLDWGITGLAAGQLVALLLALPVRVWYARHLLRPVFSSPLLRTVLRFALPLVPGTVAWWVFGFSDRMVLGWLSTLHEVGLYSVANSATTLLGLLVAAVGLAWTPHALRMYEERRNETPAFYGRMLTYTIVAFGALAVFVTTFAHELLVVLTGQDYLGAERAIGPLALGFVAFATVQVTQLGMTLLKRTSYLAIAAWVAAVVNVGLNIAFVPSYGMRASAWATFVAYLALTVFYFVISQRLWPITVDARKVIVAAGVTFVFTIGVHVLPHFGWLADLAVKFSYVAAYAILLVATRVVAPSDLDALSGTLRRLIPRGLAT
jgi:O-antigen/teichoic acid export membrane protein